MERPFGRGPTTPLRGLTITMVINHLLTGSPSSKYRITYLKRYVGRCISEPKWSLIYLHSFSQKGGLGDFFRGWLFFFKMIPQIFPNNQCHDVGRVYCRVFVIFWLYSHLFGTRTRNVATISLLKQMSSEEKKHRALRFFCLWSIMSVLTLVEANEWLRFAGTDYLNFPHYFNALSLREESKGNQNGVCMFCLKIPIP